MSNYLLIYLLIDLLLDYLLMQQCSNGLQQRQVQVSSQCHYQPGGPDGIDRMWCQA